MDRPSRNAHFYQYESGEWKTIETGVVVEHSVTLSINGAAWLSFQCTPANLKELAVGFLYHEQLIQSPNEIASIHICASGENIDIWLYNQVKKPETWRRTSGCTGGLTAVDPQQRYPHQPDGMLLSPSTVSELIRKLFDSQDLYRQTGGIHTSALANGEKILAVAEDIGRHNTFDKLTGYCLLNGIPIKENILLTTGRISSEMMQKAARMGVSVVISRTSPTTLAVELARQTNITLIGYARRNRFNVYTHPERIENIKSAPNLNSDASVFVTSHSLEGSLAKR